MGVLAARFWPADSQAGNPRPGTRALVRAWLALRSLILMQTHTPEHQLLTDRAQALVIAARCIVTRQEPAVIPFYGLADGLESQVSHISRALCLSALRTLAGAVTNG